MSALKNDLAAVTKTLKQLSRKTEQLAKKVDTLEKVKAAKKPKAKKAAKAKTKRRVVTKRRTITKKKARKKRVAAKRPAAKRAAKKSASEVLLDLMRKSRGTKGVATALLQKKTGFNNQKIRDNIYKLTKRGKIRRVGRGVYTVT